ncbi:MAG: preprotein translocase subunit SecA [Pirellulales bacterium]|nr:preprotein translocase subunit SecA [Pirellulales bacterium]
MGAIPTGIYANWAALFGGPVGRRIAQWAAILPRIEQFGGQFAAMSDAELRKTSLALKYRSKSGETLASLLPEAFALVREAGDRTLKMRHFEVQLLGGIALFNRSIAEMQTGEGKTLTATLPMYLLSLTGKGVHLATVNDYLARRDAEWMRPIYELLGVSVGVVETQSSNDERRRAYACDVTYGTAKEFGFDFLRDRLLIRRTREGQADVISYLLDQHQAEEGGDQPVQRAPYFALVDEADSVLIDEARTPLIISALPTAEQRDEAELYKWAAKHAPQFEQEEHFTFDPKTHKVELTGEGRRLVRNLPRSAGTADIGILAMYDAIELGIRAERHFLRDRHYVVRKGEIVIVDEFTGRLAEGRKWRDGLHQAVEAKENVEVTIATGHAARVTVQDYFQRYPYLAGMTGTASTSAREMHKIYKLRVIPIPTHRPPVRRQLPPRIYGNRAAKERRIVEETAEVHATGRPVLIGTRSIDKSLSISALLTQAGIAHQVLTAYQVDKEASIVEQAGQLGKVTVSTNMAGRGTDIKLGPGVHELGGLHVICTELHDSARIDRQLIGRCGRQGDPGTYRQYLALDDDILLMGLGNKTAERLKVYGERAPEQEYGGYLGRFRRAQNIMERRHFRDRKLLMYHEKDRKKIQHQMGQDPYLDAPS